MHTGLVNEKLGFSAYLGAHVRAGGEVAGIVCFNKPPALEAPFDDKDATLLALIARAIGPPVKQRTHDKQS